MDEPPLLIVGSGAMACFLAAQISAAGISVCLLDEWLDGLQWIRTHGINLQIADHQTQTHVLTCLPGEALPRVNYALVLVKSWQTDWAARQLVQCLNPQGLVLSLQNGLGNEQTLKNQLNPDRVLAGITTLGATLISPGKVRAFSGGEIFIPSHPGQSQLLSLFQTAQFNIQARADIISLIWGKLMVNAVVNPLTALLDIPNGQLARIPAARPLIQAVLQETLSVARLENINLPYTDPIQHIQTVLQQTSGNFSSMLQDLRRGAPTEIDYINGALVSLAREHGKDLPVNQTLIALIKSRLAAQSLQGESTSITELFL